MSTFQNWGGEEEETEEFEEKKGGKEFWKGERYAVSSATPAQTLLIIVIVAIIILVAWFMDDTATRGWITTGACVAIYGLMLWKHRSLMNKYGPQINADEALY